MMDFDYVVAPILIVIGGSIVIALVIRRLRSLRSKRAAGSRQLFQRITLTAMAAIALSVAASQRSQRHPAVANSTRTTWQRLRSSRAENANQLHR